MIMAILLLCVVVACGVAGCALLLLHLIGLAERIEQHGADIQTNFADFDKRVADAMAPTDAGGVGLPTALHTRMGRNILRQRLAARLKEAQAKK